MITIPQGKPNPGYFKVFIPVSEQIKQGDIVLCEHPQSDVETRGVCRYIITESWLHIPDWICYDSYGVNAITLKKALEEKIEAHRNQDSVRILIIEIEN